MEWLKSSFSAECNNCVEVSKLAGTVVIRDSKDPDGPRLNFTPDEWDAFVRGVKNKEFD